eukprot:9488715-Pyramimonas_sp.AAC.1
MPPRGQDGQKIAVGLVSVCGRPPFVVRGPFTFCGSCGVHSCDNAQLLAADCRGQCPHGSAARKRLDRLWGGHHP